MVIAFCITAIKCLIGRLFSTVIMYKIINQICSAIMGDAFKQVDREVKQKWVSIVQDVL